ncbi:MAG TPA: hypothetical protein VGT61_12005 [Thermomicrobiales bacterium]|jgi:hypothetical protein|nr:hypothetical protein [Thermomicrobiales bacterium]
MPSEQFPDPDEVPDERRTHLIRSEVALIHGHNQLLRRRVRAGRAYSRDELLRHTDTVDRAMTRLAGLLDVGLGNPPDDNQAPRIAADD